MYIIIVDYLNQNTSYLKPLPHFHECFTAFKRSIAEIDNCAGLLKYKIPINTYHPLILRDNVIALARYISRRLAAYARQESNEVLLAEVEMAESDKMEYSYFRVCKYVYVVYNRANEMLPYLAPYGVTTETMAKLQKAIDSFVAIVPLSRYSIASKHKKMDQLVYAFRAAEDALDRIDTLIETIKVEHSNFYLGYRTVRRIVVYGTNPFRIKGTSTNEETGKPLTCASRSFYTSIDTPRSLAKESVVLTKAPEVKGGFYIKSLPEGMYRVTIKKSGYKERIVSVVVTKGEMELLCASLFKN